VRLGYALSGRGPESALSVSGVVPPLTDPACSASWA